MQDSSLKTSFFVENTLDKKLGIEFAASYEWMFNKLSKTIVSNSDNCPSNCLAKILGACYAASGHTAMNNDRFASEKKLFTRDELRSKIKSLSKFKLFRWNITGDYVGDKTLLDKSELYLDADSSSHLKNIAYTHYGVEYTHNIEAIKNARAIGLNLNNSCDNPHQVKMSFDAFKSNKQMTCLTVPSWVKDNYQIDKNIHGIVCPVAAGKLKNCAACMICSKFRKAVVMFPAHGTSKKRVDNYYSHFFPEFGK